MKMNVVMKFAVVATLSGVFAVACAPKDKNLHLKVGGENASLAKADVQALIKKAFGEGYDAEAEGNKELAAHLESAELQLAAAATEKDLRVEFMAYFNDMAEPLVAHGTLEGPTKAEEKKVSNLTPENYNCKSGDQSVSQDLNRVIQIEASCVDAACKQVALLITRKKSVETDEEQQVGVIYQMSGAKAENEKKAFSQAWAAGKDGYANHKLTGVEENMKAREALVDGDEKKIKTDLICEAVVTQAERDEAAAAERERVASNGGTDDSEVKAGADAEAAKAKEEADAKAKADPAAADAGTENQ